MSIVEREATSVTSPVKSEPVVEPLWPELLEAADLLRDQPWRRCCSMNVGGNGTQCMMNAVADAGGSVSIAAERLGFAFLGDAWAWNDAPGRTLEEVLERLERAAYGL